MASTLQRKQLLTLADTAQFSYPLTPLELYFRLLSSHKVPFFLFVSEQQNLIQRSIIFYKNGHLFLSNVSDNEQRRLLSLRKIRKSNSQIKWKDAYRFVHFAKLIPFISGIAITGSLAVNNAVTDDDVDFLIVTQKHRLWITRLLVILFASFVGKRRSFAQEEKNSWCFNLWVEESDIQLPKTSRSVYEAYEVAQTVWVYSKNSVDRYFYKCNYWVNQYVYWYHEVSKLNSTKEVLRSKFSVDRIFLISFFFDLINYFAYLFQFIYMKRHMTREKVSLTHAFFHPRDTKKMIFSKWKKSLLGIS